LVGLILPNLRTGVLPTIATALPETKHLFAWWASPTGA
jgi:hypothetical protein